MNDPENWISLTKTLKENSDKLQIHSRIDKIIRPPADVTPAETKAFHY